MSTDSFHKSALAAAFLSGAAGIYLFKENDSQWGPAIWSLFVMGLFCLAAWTPAWGNRLLGGRRGGVDPETVGDNCYYLGFVFTLVSLAVTLYQLFPAGAEADAEDGTLRDTLRQVVSGFGIALVSTIVGIALRVLHIRMRPDVPVLAHDSRRELEGAAHDFRMNLSASLRTVRGFAVETRQLLSEQREDMRKAAAEDAEAQRRALAASVEAQVAALGDALRSAAGKAVAALTDSVAAAAQAGHGELAARAAAMRAAVADLARKETEAVASVIEDAERARNEFSRLGATLSSFVRSFDSAADISDRLDPAIGGFRERIAGAAGALSETDAALSVLAATIEKSNAGFSDLVSRLDAADAGIPERLRAALDGFHARLARAADALAEVDGALSGLVERFDAANADMSGRLDPAVGAFRSGLVTVAQTLAQTADAFREMEGRLSRDANDVERAAAAVPVRRRRWRLFG